MTKSQRWGSPVSNQQKTDGVSPRSLFRLFAIAEMFTWAGLITALISRASDGADFVSIAGGIHGFVFLSYATTTVFVWVNQKWRFVLGLSGVVLAIVPFATVPFEIAIDRKGLLNGGWRLAPGGETPRGFVEHVQAWILRHLAVSLVLLILFITALFITLLWLGPPVPKS